MGAEMTTEIIGEDATELDVNRLREFKRITGQTLGSAAEYLRLIGAARFFAKSLLVGPGCSLYLYVVYGV